MRILSVVFVLLAITSCANTGNPPVGKYIASVYFRGLLTGSSFTPGASTGEMVPLVIDLGESATELSRIHLRVKGGGELVATEPTSEVAVHGTDLDLAQGSQVFWKMPDTDADLWLYVQVENETREIYAYAATPARAD